MERFFRDNRYRMDGRNIAELARFVEAMAYRDNRVMPKVGRLLYEYTSTGLLNWIKIFLDTGQTVLLYECIYQYRPDDLVSGVTEKFYDNGKIYSMVEMVFEYDTTGNLTGETVTETIKG